MKELIKRAARKLGYEISDAWYAHDFLPHLHLRDVFQRAGIECVLDVGANRGQYRDFLRNALGFKGWILSFEPAPEQVEVLTARSKLDPRWLIFPVALGDVGGEAQLNVTENGVLSSFLTPLPDSHLASNKTIKNQVAVQVRTLDSMIDTITQRAPLAATYLKMDTQGFDLAVLRGAGKALGSIPALQTELAIVPTYEGMPTLFDVFTFLKGAGFELTGLFPVARTDSLRVVEFDGVFAAAKMDFKAPLSTPSARRA